MHPNPFTIGPLRSISYMFGRSEVIGYVERRVREIRTDQSSGRVCLLGAPGTGKTSLLKHVQGVLRSENWFCGYSEASPDAATAIDEFLEDARQALPRGRLKLGRGLFSRFSELSVSFAGVSTGVKLTDPGGRPVHARVREFFKDLGRVAKNSGTGVAFLIDEAQALPERDIDLLTRIVGNIGDYPIAIIMAGLPGIPEKMGRGETTDATRRYIDLRALTYNESCHALWAPIRDSGGLIEASAIHSLAKFSEGHPLTLQLLGSAAWEHSDQNSYAPPRINVLHAAEAIESAQYQLRRAYYEPMWMRCNAVERELLTRVASAGARAGYHQFISRVYESMPGAEEALYALRGRGIIDIGSDDRIDFSIPGFLDFVLRQPRRRIILSRRNGVQIGLERLGRSRMSPPICQ